LADGSNGVALFPLRDFALVSNKIPASWQIGWDSEILVLGPEAWNQIGFWEEYYDRNPNATRLFEEEFKKIVSADP